MADWGKLWDSYLGSYSDPSFDPGALGGDVKTLGSAIGKATGLAPTSTAGIDAAAADAKALEQMFLQQMGQSQPIPGLVQPNGTVVGQPVGQGPGAAVGASASQAPYTAPPASALPPAASSGGAGVIPPTNYTPISTAAPVGSGVGSQSALSNGRTVNQALGQAPPPSPLAAKLSAALGRQAPAPAGTSPLASIASAALGTTPNSNRYWISNPAQVSQALAGAGGALAPATGGVSAGPMAPAQDTSQSDQFRAGQMALAGNLQSVLNGQAPSVAQLQQQQAFQQQQAQQLGMAAAAGRGGNQALALRAALGNVGQLGAQQAGQSALLRAQEQATARSQMGDVVNSGRAQDIGIAGANQQSQIGTRQQNINQAQNQAQNVLGANQNEQTAAGIAYNAANQRQQQIGNLVSTGLSLLSDERAKTDVKTESPSDIREFLAAINPVSYRYKMSPQDQKVGVIAQDVERSKVGKTFVKNTPAGKAIDVAAATGPFLAAIGHLHRRLNALEQRSNPVERGGSTDTIKAA